MSSSGFLSASQAASRLGISIKALRLYEQRGLVAPLRSNAGWRSYGPEQMERAAQIAGLRALGFSLAQVARVLSGDPQGLEPALAAHQATLEGQLHGLATNLDRLRGLRADLARGQVPSAGELMRLVQEHRASDIHTDTLVAFDLPWPWGGERFELREIKRLTYITGPLGSGKTRLAMRLAEAVPGAVFVGLDRLAPDGTTAQARLESDAALRARVEKTLAWLVEEGGVASPALIALLAALEMEGAAVLVIDLLEQGLDQATQEALIAHLRRPRPGTPPLLFLTRSTAILDLDAVGGEETILYCPANHSVPLRVMPYPGAPGYESLASCLAPPEVRARTAGVIAWRPPALARPR